MSEEVRGGTPKGKEKRATGRVYMVLVAPQGFEPRSSESESLVLPLNEGATSGEEEEPRSVPR